MTEFITVDEAKILFNKCLAKARHHIEVDANTDKLFDGRTIVTFTFLGNGYQVEYIGGVKA
ncbi:DUF1655 domain-containing protein [Lactococcus petauri]|uniref:DUF1655 domain-containing protein n=1 Tax=Lactococcus petauri TaxID=1940789 RepID=UPI0002EB065E|nr:DUF1655 domain-containing protein [Lactococcus petauri]MCV5953407.1 DUF1655 domain-containing protein [Lactococcus petauri]MCV5968422.1 DUF1655 domain-containing protein [Lactococcus petauri]MCV5970125.1 DUF1655 domain-containing protein [Lactococcus petauri]MCV5981738.1 DUF1655 domain-containing protein [Lactococcus petauri]TBH82214.1 DUF1655 domain-containing protein [Lactococcus petauri]